jgi:hypothetical protein
VGWVGGGVGGWVAARCTLIRARGHPSFAGMARRIMAAVSMGAPGWWVAAGGWPRRGCHWPPGSASGAAAAAGGGRRPARKCAVPISRARNAPPRAAISRRPLRRCVPHVLCHTWTRGRAARCVRSCAAGRHVRRVLKQPSGVPAGVSSRADAASERGASSTAAAYLLSTAWQSPPPARTLRRAQAPRRPPALCASQASRSPDAWRRRRRAS